MKLVTYTYQSADGKDQLGAFSEGLITPLSIPPTEFYAPGKSALADLIPSGEPTVSVDDVIVRPIALPSSKIICVGLNYRKHAEESGMPAPAVPILFGKFNNALAGNGECIPVSSSWQEVDYEAELAVIIGKQAQHINEADALDYVLGYTCANDLSERNLQLQQPGGQWLLGKTLDKFLPIGPYLTTADEISDPQALTIKGWLNGELRQSSYTSDMIFSVAQIIAYISRFFTLNAGDIICTGTPEGVIMGMSDRNYMKPGDEYTVEIEHLGRLTNLLTERV